MNKKGFFLIPSLVFSFSLITSFLANDFVYRHPLKGVVSTNTENGNLSNICEIKFHQMTNYYDYGSALNDIQVVKVDGSFFNFGSLISNQRFNAEFDNALISATNTANAASSFYYPGYAIAGYKSNSSNDWYDPYLDMWQATGAGEYQIIFKEPQYLEGIWVSDTPLKRYGTTRGQDPEYRIDLSDCSGNTIKKITIKEKISPSKNQAGYLSFNN